MYQNQGKSLWYDLQAVGFPYQRKISLQIPAKIINWIVKMLTKGVLC